MSEYKRLKSLHRKRREKMTDRMSLRIHRSLSWLQAAEETADGPFMDGFNL